MARAMPRRLVSFAAIVATVATVTVVGGLAACAPENSASTVWAQPAGSAPMPAGTAPSDAAPVDAPTSETTAPPAPTLDQKYIDAARKLSGTAESDTRAWDRLAFISDTFGHRLSGSESLEKTIDWSLEIMAADGLSNVRRESVMVPHWVRGEESATILG